MHIFYEERLSFLDKYQELVLNEPESSVSHELKMGLLKIRAEVERKAAQHTNES